MRRGWNGAVALVLSHHDFEHSFLPVARLLQSVYWAVARVELEQRVLARPSRLLEVPPSLSLSIKLNSFVNGNR